MVRCHVRGPVAPLLKVLANAGVTELLSREPSLEELFLAQYGGDAQSEGAEDGGQSRAAQGAQGDAQSAGAQGTQGDGQSQGARHGAR